MDGLRGEIARFLEVKKTREANARQLAALQIACHVDISDALHAEPTEKTRIMLRLERLLERERLRGARRHWSYDLNRHIALKQALDRLRASHSEGRKAVGLKKKPDDRQTRSGARRRRSKSGLPAAPLETPGRRPPN